MPYCNTEFHTISPEQVHEVLSTLAKEFVGGRDAYLLSSGTYSIDAGENDIRAMYDEENITVRFFCRYERDKGRYDTKIQSFASKHGLETRQD